MNYSRFVAVANVGTLPAITRLPNGGQRGYFRICCNDVWRGADGERKQRENWYTVVAFQKGETGLLTSVFPLIRKGQQILVEASPVMRQWKDKENQQHETFELQIGPNDTIVLLGRKPGDNESVSDAANSTAPSPPPASEGDYDFADR